MVNPYGKYKRHNDAHESFITVNFAAKLGTPRSDSLNKRTALHSNTKRRTSLGFPGGYGAWQLAVIPRAIWIGWLDKYESSMKETQQPPWWWPPRKQHHRPYMKSASLYSGRNNCGWCGIGTSNNSFRRFPFYLASIPLPTRLVREICCLCWSNPTCSLKQPHVAWTAQ